MPWSAPSIRNTSTRKSVSSQRFVRGWDRRKTSSRSSTRTEPLWTWLDQPSSQQRPVPTVCLNNDPLLPPTPIRGIFFFFSRKRTLVLLNTVADSTHIYILHLHYIWSRLVIMINLVKVRKIGWELVIMCKGRGQVSQYFRHDSIAINY